MANKDRIFFISITILASSLLLIYVDGTEEMVLFSISAFVITLSIALYFLFYQNITNLLFYNVWAFNGLCLLLVLLFEDEPAYGVLVVLLILWLGMLGSDLLLRQPYSRKDR